MTFKEWWDNVPSHELVVDENWWDKQIASTAWNAAIEAAAELVYEMDFMANEHVAKLIRGLKDGNDD